MQLVNNSNPELIRKTFLFILIGLLLFNFSLSSNPVNRLYPPKTVDEYVWSNTSISFETGGIHALIEFGDNKPLPFLLLEALFQAGHTILYTRILNIIIIAAITIIIYKITDNKLSFLYPIIPITFSSMWLTSGNVELLFITLAILYEKHRGTFIGLASLFRPYALIFLPLLNKQQIKTVLIIGLLYSAILFLLGGFSIYFNTASTYPNDLNVFTRIIYIKGVILLSLFAISGSGNKELFKFGLLACISILIRPMFGTYYLTASSIFFISSLKQKTTINNMKTILEKRT